MKLSVDFSFVRFSFSFYRFTIKSIFKLLLTLFQISLYFTSNPLNFIEKGKYLVSSKSLLYTRILGSIMYKCLTFLIHRQTINFLKPLLPKGNLLGTAILLMQILLIEIGFLCCRNLCFLISVFPEFIISLPIFYVIIEFS